MEYYTDKNVYSQEDWTLIQKLIRFQKGIHLCGYKNSIYHSLSSHLQFKIKL